MQKDTSNKLPDASQQEPDDLIALAQAHNLTQMGLRPPLLTYVKQTWQKRDFMSSMAVFRMRGQMEENRLGFLWFIIRPILDSLIYGAIFGVLQGNSRPPDYVAYVVTGVFLFNFFTASFADGGQSIIGSRVLVQTLAFPRATLPLSRVLQDLYSMLPSIALLPFILMLRGHYPSFQWLLLIPLIVLLTLFCSGAAMLAARVTVHLRDLSQLIPVISRLLFYTSGVLFDVNKIFTGHPLVVTLYNFHPLYQVLRIARGVMMGTDYPLHYWIDFSAWSVAVFILGLIYFWAAEERYGSE